METTTCAQCGGPVEQTGRGRPRRFCTYECGVKFANDQKPRKYGQNAYNAKRHMLTNITPETEKTGRADCSQCGPRVRVWDVGGTRAVRWRCANAVNSQPGRVRHKHGRGREAAWARRGIDLTVAQFDAMYEAQGGACAVCGDELGKKPHVDHCHATGVVRGVTCQRCNRVMGLLGDDPSLLRRMIEYLERNATTAIEP